MAKLLATIKAIITRVVFACHGIVAIWQVTIFKCNMNYWYLALPTLLLFAEGFFTLTIKENQEWKWFCPSVFIYLGSVVPAIWLLELHKVEKRIQAREEHYNLTMATGVDLKDLSKMLGGKVHLPDIPFSTETWVTLIEQFLMLTLIVGRWLLPKGDLTRDQLSQLLLVYIGTAADIIEFFDSFKDDKIVSEPLLVLLTLGIWSWSLLQFTVVLTATKSRKSRVSANGSLAKNGTTETCCCSIDVCAIMMNIALQDAPFLSFRLLIIIHYRIVSYMNVFFTCKNTLVILLQIYRLYVVHSETNKSKNKKVKRSEQKHSSRAIKEKRGKQHKRREKSKDQKIPDFGMGNIAIISNPNDIHKLNSKKNIKLRAFILKNKDVLRELDLVRAWKETEIKLETENKGNNSNEDKHSEKRSKRSKNPEASEKRRKNTSDDERSSPKKSKSQDKRWTEEPSRSKKSKNRDDVSNDSKESQEVKKSKKSRELEICAYSSGSESDSSDSAAKSRHKDNYSSSNSTE